MGLAAWTSSNQEVEEKNRVFRKESKKKESGFKKKKRQPQMVAWTVCVANGKLNFTQNENKPSQAADEKDKADFACLPLVASLRNMQ